MEIEVNKYQTQITDELLSAYPEEVREQLFDFINGVEFIKWLISPDRPYAKDCPHDEEGKVIVDLAHPHIVQDMDYFRQPALHFMKYGCYTFLRPNSNPHSEYRKFWAEEKRRCYEGYVRESDGEWVTGLCYWFLNYNPMLVNRIVEGTRRAERIESFPFFFEGIYWRFHYLKQAKLEGKHAIELAKRGAHPYFQKVFTPNGWTTWENIHVGDYLYGTDGKLTKIIDIPYDEEAPYYKITLRDGREVYASDDHKWVVKIHNHKNIETLTTTELVTIYKGIRKVSPRLPNGVEYRAQILKNNGVDFPYRDTKVDPYTFGFILGDGCFRHASCYVTQETKDMEELRKYIPYTITKWSNKYAYNIVLPSWKPLLEEYGLLNAKSEDKFIPSEYKYNSREVRLNLLRGLMDTDGCAQKKRAPYFNTVSKELAEDVMEIARSLGYNCSCCIKKAGYRVDGILKECLPCYNVTIYAGPEIFNLQRKKDNVEYKCSRAGGTMITNIEYVGKTRCKCVTVDASDQCYLIGDFITTHNCAKSYSLSSIMTHNLILGEDDPDPDTHRRRTTTLTAYEKEYLKDDKDGTFSKFKPALGFIFSNTPFPHLMLKNSPNEMSWQMGYKNELGVECGSFNQVLGVSAKDNPDKLRGKRGWVLFEEMGSFKGLLALYDSTRKGTEDGNYTFATMYLVGCVCAGTKVWTQDGRYISIEELTKQDGIIGFSPEVSVYPDENCELYLNRGITNEPILSNINTGTKNCVRIVLNNGNILECSKDHPIFIQKLHSPKHSNRYYEEVFKFAGDLKIGDRVIEAREVPVFGNDTLFDARLVGMLIGDGTYGLHNSVKYCSEDKELLEYVCKYNWRPYASHITKQGNTYKEGRIVGLVQSLRKIGIYGQTKTNKRLPINYQLLDRENTIKLLSGLYDTDGSVCLSKKDGYIYLTQSNREILEQVKILWRKFGVVGAITKTNPAIREGRKDKNPWYTLIISGRYNAVKAAETLQLLVAHKRENLKKIIDYYTNNPSKKERNYPKDIIVSTVKEVEDLGEQTVYNLTAGLSHTYLANNIITHNTAAEDESDFTSAKTLLYSPEGYNIYYIKNVFDKKGQGKANFGFFFPAYINRAGCYNKDGVSDVVKALLEILMARYKAKYSADPQSVLRVIAEDPITPAEAIIKVKASYFPTASLNERIAQLDEDAKAYNDVYVGELVLKDGEVTFRPTGDVPIHKYGVDNSTRGALEIFEMPEKNREGKVFNERYIIGHDPVDNDQADSSSLSSTFVFDLFTDKIVAEYTGRQPFADDNFEIVRKLCLFYNARCLFESNKKGIFAYFAKMNCTHLLAETPEYLREKQLVKYSAFGSSKYGVNASAAINDYANGLLRDWLLKPIVVINKGADGELEENTIPILYTIRNRALLEELVSYTPELNVDRIRAMGMVMLYRQEKIILYQGDMSAERDEKADANYLGNDKFFSRNYDRRHNFQ